jgi:molybdopterin-guanine dinucleotide biosynthesis protein A
MIASSFSLNNVSPERHWIRRTKIAGVTAPPMTGLLLAGGAGSRMGADKALLEFEGEPLAARVLRTLRSACEEVLVASGDGERLAALGAPQVPDAIPGGGPLAGIAAGLAISARELVAVVAVDMPYANAGVLRLLAERWNGEHAVVPVTENGLEPLHAVYAASAAPLLRRALDDGTRSVREALRAIRTRGVPESEWRAVDPSGRFAFNVNRPEDLDRVQPSSP